MTKIGDRYKMEYKEFAKYYDLFYKNKNYAKETEFLKNLSLMNKI